MTFSTIRPKATVLLAVLTFLAGLAVMPVPAAVAGDVFDDVDNASVFADDIEWLAGVGVTRGCNPPTNTLFCPHNVVTRGQMAAFLSRALALPAASGIDFVDDNGSTFENDIERLAGAGITRGCNPPTNNRFCPDDPVTRGQMAAFLARALDLDAGSGIDFTDDNDSLFEADIERLAAAGITRGCNPPTNNRFCPNDLVTRQQMAAFLHRALGDRLFVKAYLMDLSPVDTNEFVDEGAISVNGRRYTKSVWWARNTNSSPGWAEYNLGRDYSSFCAVAGISDYSETFAAFDVEVYLDGISVFSGPISVGDPLPIAVDVTDGLRLKIETRTRSENNQDARIVWADAHLQESGDCTIPAGDPYPPTTPTTYLMDKTVVDTNEFVDEGAITVNGTLYTKSVWWARNTNSSPGWAEYNLGRDYSSFCAVAGISDGSEAAAAFELNVYLDGVLISSGDVALGQPIDISADVANGLRLKIESVSKASNNQDARIVWADSYVSTGSCS